MEICFYLLLWKKKNIVVRWRPFSNCYIVILELQRFWNMHSPFVFDCVDMGVKTYMMRLKGILDVAILGIGARGDRNLQQFKFPFLVSV